MFKKLIALIALVGVSPVALAAFPAAQTARIKFATTPVLTSGYTQVLANTTRPIGSISFTNSGPTNLQLAIGAAGSEVVQLTLVSTAATTVTPLPVLIPAGQRVSVISLDQSTGVPTGGELDVNFLFN